MLPSTGRVQGPTLKFLAEREKTIKSFVPTPYWNITAKINVEGIAFDAEYEEILDNKQNATEIVKSCKTKEGQIEAIDVEEFEQKPPFPFDLGALQSEAYRVFRYSPMRTSNVAQHLYLDALISYPRTSSQKLPQAIGYKAILRKLSKMPAYARQATELLSKPQLKPTEGPKVDSAHPAIYPTGTRAEKPQTVAEKNIFDLIIRRFMTVFAEPAIRQSIKATVGINGNRFQVNGIRTLIDGWFGFYKPYVQLKDVTLPTLIEGQKIDVKRVILKENFTKPPARYNPKSLLLKMEKEEIGTKATRASTIQTLFDRKYLTGTDSLVVSELGFEVIEILSKYCPIVISPELTQALEAKMNEIQQGKETKKAVLQDATKILKHVMVELKEKESVIGKLLDQTLKKAMLDERVVGECPKCADGKLVILRSKKTKKRFIGCTNYFEGKCDLTYPLPQMGTIKPLSKACKICGSPTIYVLMKAKRPWKLCLNPDCPSKGANKK